MLRSFASEARFLIDLRNELSFTIHYSIYEQSFHLWWYSLDQHKSVLNVTTTMITDCCLKMISAGGVAACTDSVHPTFSHPRRMVQVSSSRSERENVIMMNCGSLDRFSGCLCARKLLRMKDLRFSQYFYQFH